MVPVRFRGRRVIVDGSVFLDGVVVHQTVTEQIFVTFIGRIQNAADLGCASTGITQRIERGGAHGFCDDGVVGLIHRTHAHVSEVIFCSRILGTSVGNKTFFYSNGFIIFIQINRFSIFIHIAVIILDDSVYLLPPKIIIGVHDIGCDRPVFPPGNSVIIIQGVVIKGCPFQGIQVSPAVVFLIDILHEGSVIGIIIIVTESGSDAVSETRVGIIRQIRIDGRSKLVSRLVIRIFRILGVVRCREHSADTHQQCQHQSQTQKSFPVVVIHFVSPFPGLYIRIPSGFRGDFTSLSEIRIGGIYDQAAHSA